MIQSAGSAAQAGFPALREQIARHSRSTTILAALGAALDAQTTGVSLAPALQERIDETLAAVGMGAAITELGDAEQRQLLAEIRFALLLDAKLLFHSTRTLAWAHTEPELLQAGGDVSAGFAEPLTRAIVPRLEGLAQRLHAPGAAFLDIGVGSAGLAIALAQRWPSLRVVGIDPWEPSLALARENVRSAGLAERIALREQAAEQLGDVEMFDLAWLPSAFMPAWAIPAACERVYRALRPGGWLLFAMANPGGDPLAAAVVRLRTVLWGGSVIAPGQIEALLSERGFVEIQALPSPPGAVAAMVAARRGTD